MTKVLVTGGSGFVGSGLIPVLAGAGHELVVFSRRPPRHQITSAIEWHVIDPSNRASPPKESFKGVEVVIHLAAIAHVPEQHEEQARQKVIEVNVHNAVNRARLAAEQGVRRFVFVSSASVHGTTSGARPFTENSPLYPTNLYARSKIEAENELRTTADKHGIELTIIRPPLIYGPGAKGNFARLLHWALAGRPLPKVIFNNKRSFVGLGNLCHFIQTAMTHPAAANQTFLVSDGEDISPGELYRRLSQACGKKARFVPIPYWAIASALHMAGQGSTLTKLFGNLQIDSSKAQSLLNWQASIAVDEELERVVNRVVNNISDH